MKIICWICKKETDYKGDEGRRKRSLEGILPTACSPECYSQLKEKFPEQMRGRL
jgi:hypothetical protein